MLTQLRKGDLFYGKVVPDADPPKIDIQKGDLFYGKVVPDAGLAKLGHGKG